MSGDAAGQPSSPRLGVVVVSYGSSELLRRNLVPLSGALPEASVVVVDSLTTIEERAAVAELAAEHGWTFVATDENVGFGRGMNLGAARALALGCTHLLLLNPDVAVEAPAVIGLLAAARRHQRALVTPLIALPDGAVWFAGGRLDRRTGLTRSRADSGQGPDGWLTGACLLVERGDWEALGGFDDRYFLYWEDIDLSQRHLARGGSLWVERDVRVVHQVGGTQGTGGKTRLYCRYNCRNRLLFAAGSVPPRMRLRWLVHTPRYAAHILTLDGGRAALRRPGHAVAALRGTLEGIVWVARSSLRDASWGRRRG